MTGTDEHNIADAPRDQLKPAQDEGVQKDVAQFAVGLYQSQQCFAFYFDQFARFCRTDAYEPPSSRKHSQFAGKHSWTTDGEYLFLIVSDAEDFQLAGANHEEFCGLLIEFDECFRSRDL